jgi:hypothetical protein
MITSGRSLSGKDFETWAKPFFKGLASQITLLGGKDFLRRGRCPYRPRAAHDVTSTISIHFTERE